MKIGELAARTGASPRSLRHYEASGLIRAVRRDNGYREFPDHAVEQVKRIRVLLDCGFTIEEIRPLAPCLADDGFDHEACAEGVERHLRKLDEIESLIAVLENRRALLVERLHRFGVSRDANRLAEDSPDANPVNRHPTGLGHGHDRRRRVRLVPDSVAHRRVV